MATISQNRADYLRPNINRIGNHHAKKQAQIKAKRRIASDAELNEINKAILALNEAKQAMTEATFLVKVSDAMRISRNIWRGRQD